MSTDTDQRAYDRYAITAPIIYSGTATGIVHQGVMVNCSQGGMAFRSRMSLPEGGDISLFSPEAARKCPAEVVWCAADPQADAPVFRIGVKYTDEPGLPVAVAGGQERATVPPARDKRRCGAVVDLPENVVGKGR